MERIKIIEFFESFIAGLEQEFKRDKRPTNKQLATALLNNCEQFGWIPYYEEKMEYNVKHRGHKKENRQGKNGKKF